MLKSHPLPPTPSSTPAPRRLSRRAFLQGAVTMVGLAASGCAWADVDPFAFAHTLTAESSPPPGREEIQLVYQDWRADWVPGMVEAMLAQFHETHPDLRVFFTPDPDNLASAMVAEMEAGTAPDLFWGGSTFFPIWAQAGHLLDLRPYVAADLDESTIADWDPAQYQAFFLRDGRQFGLPKYHGAVALYYNRDLFDAAGMPYPTADWSREAYLAAITSLTRHSNTGERVQWGSMVDITWDRLQIYVNGWGGHLVAPYDPAYCVADETPALAALAWLRARMWDERVMATFPDVQYMSPRSAFINGRIAMVEEGSWVLKDILRSSDFRIGVVPLPAGQQRRVTLATSDGFGIYGRTAYPEAAWELLQFLTGSDYGLALAKADFLQPARASLIDRWVDFVRAEFPDKIQAQDLQAFADGHRQGYSVTVEIAENMAEVQPRLTAAFETIFTLGQAPVSSLRAVCEQINQLQPGSGHQHPHLAE